MSSLSPNLRGIVAMCIAMALFVLNDTWVKMAGKYWPPGQIMALRGIFAVAFTVLFVFFDKQLSQLKFILNPLAILRGVFEAVIAVCFISALRYMPISDITAILLVSPLLITAFSSLYLRETIGWQRWLAVFIGFIGMLIVVKPGGEAFGWPSILALISAIGVAVRDIITRKIPSDMPTGIIALSSGLCTMTMGFLLTTNTAWNPIEATPLLYVFMAAAVLAIGNLFIIIAFRGVDVSAVSPFRYSVILWAMISGAIFFGEKPMLMAVFGIALIVGSGLYSLYAETRSSRAKT